MKSQAETKKIILDDCWNTIGIWSKGKAICPILEKEIHCRNCDVYKKAGRALFQREAPPHYTDEWTQLMAKKCEHKKMGSKAVMVFRLGDEWVALSVSVIQEVVEMGIMHRVPNRTNEVMKGMISLKGALYVCVSVGGLLGIVKGEKTHDDDNKISYSERLIITSMHNEIYIFPVSEISGIFRINPNSLRGTPSTLSNSMSTYMAGIFSWQEKNIGLLDENRLYDGFSRSLS